MEYTYHQSDLEFDGSDETWQCPECGGWEEEEENAFLCCYDDEAWVEHKHSL